MKSRAESKPIAASFRGRKEQGRVQTQPPPAKPTSRAKRFTALLILCSIASILSLQAEFARQAHEPILEEAQTESASRQSEAQVAFPNRSAASSSEPLSRRPSKAVLRWRQRSRRHHVFTAQSSPAASPLNVLMILIDDLRPALGCYGDRLAVTPHMDALANQSVRFDAAYASVATCSPSRTSLLTGLRPDTHGVHDLVTHFRTTVPDATTLPQAFKRAGYLALSYGKVFHEDLDDAASWSSQADFDDGEVWRGTERVYGHDWWYMEHDSMVKVPSWWCHHRLLVWPPLGASSPAALLRYALGTNRRAAQGPMGGCGAAVRPGQSRRFRAVRHAGTTARSTRGHGRATSLVSHGSARRGPRSVPSTTPSLAVRAARCSASRRAPRRRRRRARSSSWRASCGLTCPSLRLSGRGSARAPRAASLCRRRRRPWGRASSHASAWRGGASYEPTRGYRHTCRTCPPQSSTLRASPLLSASPLPRGLVRLALGGAPHSGGPAVPPLSAR